MAHAQAVPVQGEQCWIGNRRYDVGVYRVSERYYATWFCDPCSTLKETPECDSLESARQAAGDAINLHHGERHSP